MLLNILLAAAVSIGAASALEEPVDFNKIKTHADFKLLLPGGKLARDWRVEVRSPYPLRFNEPIRNVRLHYFDPKGEYVLGIEQHKAKGYVYKKEIEIIDLRNHTSRTRIVQEHFEQSTLGEVVQIGKAKGYFVAWVDRKPIPGGILHWIQGDTYVEMESMTITKKKMIEVARSMR